MICAEEIFSFLNEVAPFCTAEEWDNSGILVNSGKAAGSALLAMDITAQAVNEAVALGCGLIIAHHPVIFSPLKSIEADSAVYSLIKNDISAVCAHTNLDKADNGVCKALADALGLQGQTKLEPFGYMGELREEQSGAEFAALCAKLLGAPVRLCAGADKLKKIAVIGGSGASFIKEAKAAGADCLVTGDSGHHDALLAQELGISLIAAGHFETESVVLKPLCEELQSTFSDTKFIISKQKSPFVFAF